MRFIFDLLKDALRWVDGQWIENAGHPIVVLGAFEPVADKDALYREDRGAFTPLPQPVLIYGFYDYPTMNQSCMFGIDSPDEMEVQVNTELLCEKLGRLPKIATVLSIEGSTWRVINRAYIYNRFIGKYRLSLTCQRYQESVTTGKHVVVEEEE